MEQRNTINSYKCSMCEKHYFTINLNAGTTPFISSCMSCKHGKCTSEFYRRMLGPNDHLMFCWYRPKPNQFKTLNNILQEHVYMGGLLKDKICDANPIDDEITHAWDFNRYMLFAKQTYGKFLSDEAEKQIKWSVNIKSDK